MQSSDYRSFGAAHNLQLFTSTSGGSMQMPISPTIIHHPLSTQNKNSTLLNKQVYVSNKMQPSIKRTLNQNPPKKNLDTNIRHQSPTFNQQVRETQQSSKKQKLTEQQQKHLFDQYCLELLKRVQVQQMQSQGQLQQLPQNQIQTDLTRLKQSGSPLGQRPLTLLSPNFHSNNQPQFHPSNIQNPNPNTNYQMMNLIMNNQNNNLNNINPLTSSSNSANDYLIASLQSFNAPNNLRSSQASSISQDGTITSVEQGIPLLQNLDLLNNFFSTSGKNNFYNSLNSFKSSPHYSPRPVSTINENDLTFANHLMSNQFQFGLQGKQEEQISDKSWDLEEDEINEFNDVDEDEPTGNNITNKPTIQFIEQQRPFKPILRSKQNENSSITRARSRDNQSQQSFSKPISIKSSISQSPFRLTSTKSPNYKEYAQPSQNYANLSISSQKNTASLNQSLKQQNINANINNKNPQNSKNQTTKDRQLGVIRSSLKKKLVSLEQQELDSIMLQKKFGQPGGNTYRFREHSNSSYNKTSNYKNPDNDSPTNQLRNKIISRLSSKDSKHSAGGSGTNNYHSTVTANHSNNNNSYFHQNKILKEGSQNHRYDNLKKISLDHLSIEESKHEYDDLSLQNSECKTYSNQFTIKQSKTGIINDRYQRDNGSALSNKRAEKLQDSLEQQQVMNNNSSGSQKRGRQSNQRNQFQPVLQTKVSRNIQQNPYEVNAVHSVKNANINKVNDIIKNQKARQSLGNNSGAAGVNVLANQQKIGGSLLFNATSSIKSNLYQPKIYNFSTLQQLEDSPLRKSSMDRNSSRHSSHSRLSNISNNNKKSSGLKKPVVHEEYLQSNKVASIRGTIFK
ncbi:UNKNOWN [Stylonychia lemnae]|uniref:Uncharacterized protein n=1 Tax=Stylonychia lemnae TaxID=5949 RepID=A0A078AI49_STYLE|nr:UNKNOWN [Stylonychia lemnae]|eukprot:CDW81930.1 UNKNOWN [Stylonychia lemnae]